MAMSLSMLGMAHRALSGQIETMSACYAYAAQCAGWRRDDALQTFFADAHLRLDREIAAGATRADQEANGIDANYG